MTIVELLKQAERIVSGLISEKTPPVMETCREALNDLSELVAHTHKSRAFSDEVDFGFAEVLNDIVERLSPLRASAVAQLGPESTMSNIEFVQHFKSAIDTALKEEPGPALARLHALRAGIQKASFIAETATITVRIYVDPFQQATKEVEGGGTPKVTSGNAGKEEVGTGGGLSFEDLAKQVFGDVKKARDEASSIDVGWTSDLTSPAFLHGKRPRVDFGRDGTK